MVRMAHTDVAVGIHHAFIGEDAVGNHKLAYVKVQVVHGVCLQRGVWIARHHTTGKAHAGKLDGPKILCEP